MNTIKIKFGNSGVMPKPDRKKCRLPRWLTKKCAKCLEIPGRGRRLETN